MTEVLNNPDIFDGDQLKPGVKIIDAENGEVVMEGPMGETPVAVSSSDKFPANKFQPDDELYLGDEISGDYHELRDVLLQKSRWNIFKAIKCLDYRRVCLLREHLLQLAAYHVDYRTTAYNVVDICTRLLSGDSETDLQLADDVFDIPDYTLSESDDENTTTSGEANDKTCRELAGQDAVPLL